MASPLDSILKSIVEDNFIDTNYELYLKGLEKTDSRDRSLLHVSNLCKCSRDTYFEFICPEKRIPYTVKQLKVFRAGTKTHEWHQADYLAAGILKSTEAKMPEAWRKKYNLIGSSDGIMPSDAVWEFKSTNENAFQYIKRVGLPLAVKKQISMYMVGLDKSEGVVEYYDRSLCDNHQFKCSPDEKLVEEMFKKAEYLWECIQDKKLPIVDVEKVSICNSWCQSRKICSRV